MLSPMEWTSVGRMLKLKLPGIYRTQFVIFSLLKGLQQYSKLSLLCVNHSVSLHEENLHFGRL